MSTRGQLINQAYDVVRRTYQEINRLKDDLEDLLSDYEPSLIFAEQYSYGTNALYLKANHTFLFKRGKEKPESEALGQQRVFAMICIFYEEDNVNRISLKDQPEIWFGLFDIYKHQNKIRPWHIYYLLTLQHRAEFKDNPLVIGRESIGYHRKDEVTGEEWRGRFIGYPLVEITDITALKEKVVEKLFMKKKVA